MVVPVSPIALATELVQYLDAQIMALVRVLALVRDLAVALVCQVELQLLGLADEIHLLIQRQMLDLGQDLVGLRQILGEGVR